MLSTIKAQAANIIWVGGLERGVDINEIKKICNLIPGKAKLFSSIARYSDSLFGKQLLIGGFDSP